MEFINTSFLILSFLTAFLALVGDKVDKPDGRRSWIRRVRLPGYVFFMLISATLLLGIYKEHISFEGRMRQVYPNFAQIVTLETELSKTEWTEIMSYRISLRFLTQRMIRKVEGWSPEYSESLQDMLYLLGMKGALDNEFCKSLDYIRFHTFRGEWGSGKGGKPEQLTIVKSVAHEVLDQLQKIEAKLQPARLVPVDATTCGTNPDPDAIEI